MNLPESWLLANGISIATLATAKGAISHTAVKPRTPRHKAVGYPVLSATGTPGPWRVELPGWRPTSLNVLLATHWAKQSRIKRATDRLIAVACLAAGVTAATGKRRVSLEIGYSCGTFADHDNIVKCVYDSLVDVGALVDDGHEWLEHGSYLPFRGSKGTTIVIEDIA